MQAKLAVGAADDPLEREADRVAAEAMRMIRRSEVPREPFSPVARKVQRMSPVGADGGEVDTDTERQIERARGGGRALPKDLRVSMERSMAADFSSVRIHSGETADRLNRSVQARAFTTGRDVFFRQGEYDPNSAQGQELIAHELAHVVQQNAGVVRSVMQRRIGFEIETGIPFMKRDDSGDAPVYESTWADRDSVDVDAAKLSPDHIPGSPPHAPNAVENFVEWPIIEMVTDPVDDEQTLGEFEIIARGWIDTIRQIKNLAQRGGARQLHDDYYVGLPTPQDFGDWDRIAPQVTVGMPIDQIGKVLAGFDETQGMYRAQLATQIGQRAPSVAADIMKDVYDQYPPGQDMKGTQALKGLVTMLVNHLMVGGEAEISRQVYMKNRPANVMFKTKLSSVRNNIMANPFVTTVLGDGAGRTLLKQRIIAATARTAGDPVFVPFDDGRADRRTDASSVSVGDWIDEVLGGHDDNIFEDMRNDWSVELAPDATDEVVIELRRIGAFVNHDNYALEDDDGLLAFLKVAYGTHQLYKQRQI